MHLAVELPPYFPDESPTLRIHSLNHCNCDAKPLEMSFSHFLAVGTSKMDELAERVHAFLLAKLPHIRRTFEEKCDGVASDDEFDPFASGDAEH